MRVLHLVLGFVLAACQPTTAVDDDDATEAPTPDPRFDPLREAIVEELATFDAPGVAVGVLQGGEIVFAEGFGDKELGGDPIDGETLFRIGSVTKMLTSMAVLQQQEAGTLTVDTTVADAIPALASGDLEDWAAEATVGNLLSHTSAIYDYLEIDGSRSDAALGQFLSAGLESLWAWAPAGRFWNYSNTGYFVAGGALEEATGRAYVDLMQEDVFGPLGMSRTWFREEDVEADGNYAVGLGWDWTGSSAGDVEVRPASYDNAWGRPAGYAWSSVGDLLGFADFLMHGDPAVAGNSLRGEIANPHISMQTLGDVERYGYGMILTEGIYVGDSWVPLQFWSHGGAIPGYSAEVHVLPDQDFAIVFLASGDGAYFRTALRAALESLVELPAAGDAPDFPPDPATDGEIAGNWIDEHNLGALTLTDEAGGVGVIAPALDDAGVPYEDHWDPYREDSYLWDIQDTTVDLTVIRDDLGVPEFLRTRFSVSVRDGGEVRGASRAFDLRAALRDQAWMRR